MKRVQIYMAWLSTFLMISTNMGWEGCSAKENAPAPVVQQASAGSTGQADSNQQAQNPGQQAQPAGAQQMQLPEVSLTADGLDELLAPVALYPDPVLAVLLQSAVDPQQVMDGGNWLVLDENKNLKEAALDEASKKAGFTPVMQALLHYPTVVDLMCTQFDWTKQLGAAYEANPRAVLDAVQRLRAQAVDNGALKSGAQMKVDVAQDNGQQVVKLEPANPKVVYVPQYDPNQVFQTTTTTTRPDGTVTTTTTTSGPAPAASTSSSSTTVVQQQSSGVSTGTAVMIGLLSFGAGVALGAAINSNNYYYPAWGYGGVWYGPRPYYPPPYHPVYYGGWHGGYYYNRPVHYGNTNIYINNTNNYYNRFQNNNNLNSNYKPRPVPYNNNANSTYSRNMGSRPEAKQGVNYRPGAGNNANAGNRPVYNKPSGGNGNVATRPAGGGGNVGNAPGGAQRPATGNNANNWKGQSAYAGNKGNQVNAGTMPARNPSGDRGFAQNGGTRPTTGNVSTGNMQGNRPNAGNAGNATYNRPSGGNAATRPTTGNAPSAGNPPATRPANTNQPASRPATQGQMQNRAQSSGGGAFGGAGSGAGNAKADRQASNRGRESMGAQQQARQAQPRNTGGNKR